tara:strand:+ start:15069 stop:16418 length:1350 start_codon:yes stop_codon:yes gene_type:complete
MPYICLARNDIPDGTLQVLDLWPNTSQRNSSIDPPGQTRYVRRVRDENVNFDAATGIATADRPQATMDGLSAYIMDRVEPGGLTAETATITFIAPALVGDRILINGAMGLPVILTGAAATDTGAPQEWAVADAGGGENGAAQFVVLFNSNAAGGLVQTDITTALGAPSVLTAAAVLNVVTITAAHAVGDDGSLYLQATVAQDDGAAGDASARIGLAGGAVAAAQTVRLNRAVEVWTTATVATAAQNIIDEVDAGNALTLALINAQLAAAAAGSELTDTASLSTGAVLDVLSILAGRSYVLPASAQILNAALITGVDAIPLKGPAVGSFTAATTVFDSQMADGEIRPLVPFTKLPNNSHARSQVNRVTGGTVVQLENGGARYTVPGGSADASVLSGHISRMQDASVGLFPDNDYSVFHGANAFFAQPGPQAAGGANARLVTSYNDDGSLL